MEAVLHPPEVTSRRLAAPCEGVEATLTRGMNSDDKEFFASGLCVTTDNGCPVALTASCRSSATSSSGNTGSETTVVPSSTTSLTWSWCHTGIIMSIIIRLNPLGYGATGVWPCRTATNGS